MSLPDFMTWHCCGCDKPGVSDSGRQKPCDCVTIVAGRDGPNGKREYICWDDPPDPKDNDLTVLRAEIATLRKYLWSRSIVQVDRPAYGKTTYHWGWRCQICGEDVERELGGPEKIDHKATCPLSTPAPADVVAVPREPTEAQWGGLARDIMMWLDMNDGSAKTPRALFKHLERVGRPAPRWLFDEPELQSLDRVPSKGTRCVIIYKAMIAALTGGSER